MAWQFVGFFHGDNGPLPCKRWVKSPDDRPHKMNYKAPRKISRAEFRPTQESYAVKAIEYCRWLAQRDGIVLPDGKATPVWDSKHIMAVAFFYPHADDKHVCIDIPNHNWVPCEPVEETIRPGDSLVEWVQYALAA